MIRHASLEGSHLLLLRPGCGHELLREQPPDEAASFGDDPPPGAVLRPAPEDGGVPPSALVPGRDDPVPRRGLRRVPLAHHPGHRERAHAEHAAVQPRRGLPDLRRALRLLQALHRRVHRRRGAIEPRDERHRDQLERRVTPREKGGGVGVLLHQRSRPRHPRAPQASRQGRVHRHRHSPRGRRRGSVLHDRSGHVRLVSQVRGPVLPGHRRFERHRQEPRQVLLRQRTPTGRHPRRRVPRHLPNSHVQGDGDVQARGDRAAVRRGLTRRRPPRVLQPLTGRPRGLRQVYEEVWSSAARHRRRGIHQE